MAIDTRTPEAAHSDVCDAIEYELTNYGPASLAAMIATLIENRVDEDQPKPNDRAWQQAAAMFRQIEDQAPTVCGA